MYQEREVLFDEMTWKRRIQRMTIQATFLLTRTGHIFESNISRSSISKSKSASRQQSTQSQHRVPNEKIIFLR